MWIESHQSLLTHRKTGRLARSLGISKITAIGHLHAFWWWCMDNAPAGSLVGIDAEDIADGSGWEGDPVEFLAALVYAGFVDEIDGATGVHDWMDYAGKLIEKREKDAERKRVERQKKDGPTPSPVRTSNVPRTSNGHPRDGAGTVPNRTVPNLTKPKKGESHDSLAPAAPSRPTPITNPLWDALVEGIGIAPKTSDERSRYGKAVKQLKEIEATPADVLAHCENYRATWPDLDLTVEALLRHWSRMDSPPPVRPVRASGGGRETTEEYNRRTMQEVLGHEPEDIPGVVDAAWRTHQQEADPRGPQVLVDPVRRSAR